MAIVSSTDPDFRTLVRACENCLSYLRLSKTRINGYSYGSDGLVVDTYAKQLLWSQINSRFRSLAGYDLPFSHDEVAFTYSSCRKGNYRALRDAKPITRETGRTLFDEIPNEPEPIATVYAYAGMNARAGRRLIKIGYTSKDLGTYLRDKQIQHMPVLLATKCGGVGEEKEEHTRYRHQLADGREWFYPSVIMFNNFASEWNVEPRFTELTAEVLHEDKGHQ